MKNLTSALSGLASSLLLNAGFEPLARKLDPVFACPAVVVGGGHGPALTLPCRFPLQRVA